MGRDVPYKPDTPCDLCGVMGAYDFTGGYLCGGCDDGQSGTATTQNLEWARLYITSDLRETADALRREADFLEGKADLLVSIIGAFLDGASEQSEESSPTGSATK